MSLPLGAVSEGDIDDFCVLGELDIVKDDKRSLDVEDGSVVDTRGDVVVGGGSLGVDLMKTHGVFSVVITNVEV